MQELQCKDSGLAWDNNKRTKEMFKTLTIVFFILTLTLPVLGSESLSYSGRLVNQNGSPVTGNVNLKFELAYTNDLNVILCSQQLSNISLSHGVFHAKLTPTCPSSTLLKVLEKIPPFNSIAIRVTDETANKQYPFQALHSMPLSVLSQTSKQLVQMDATQGQVLSWDGEKWAPADLAASSSGTMTSITVGDGLYGGTITTSGSIGIADGGVTSNKLDSMGALTTGQVLKWNGTTWTAGVDEDNGVAESNVRKFALNNDPLTPAPTCGGHQVLRYILLTDSLECFDLVNDDIDETKTNLAPSQKAVADALALKQDTIESSLKLTHTDSSWVALEAPPGGGNISYTLPLMGTNGQVLKLGSSGNLIWGDTGVNGSDIAANSITNSHVADGALSKSKISGLDSDLASMDTRITNLKTDDVAEGTTNKYFTNDRVLQAPLTGLTPTTGTVAAMDSLLVAFNKIVGNANTLSGAVDTLAANQVNYLEKGGGSMTGDLVMSGNLVTGLGVPSNDSDAATKQYVDEQTALNASKWTENVNDIYYNDGNVGIGTDTPAARLAVAGTLHLLPELSDNNMPVLSMHTTHIQTSERYFSGLYNNIASENFTLSSPHALSLRFSSDPSYPLRFYSHTWNGTSYDLVERFRLDGSNGNVSLTGQMRLKSNTNYYLEFQAPASLAENIPLILPNTKGSSGNALITDGNGNLSWSSVATTASTVGGDLNGSIANAQLNANAVGTSEIANSSVTYEKLSLLDGEIPEAKVSGLTTQLGNKEPTISAGTTSQYWRGDKTWQTLNTSAVTEGSNLYFLDSRVREALMSTYTVGSALPLANTDNLIEALGKLEGQIIANKAAFEATGHWSKNLTHLYYNSGNVGVGTILPAAKVHAEIPDIGSGFRVSDASAPTGFLTLGDAGSVASSFSPLINSRPAGGPNRFSGFYSDIFSGDDTGSVPVMVLAGRHDSGALTNRPVLQVKNNTLPLMTILPSGHVGIGVISPESLLDVGLASVSSPNTATATLVRGADPSFTLQTRTGASTNNDGDLLAKFGILYNSAFENAGINFYRGSTSTNGSMAFSTNATDRMTIKSEGQIGVGTNTPTGLMHLHTTHGGTIGGASAQMNTAGLVISNAENQYLAMDGNEIRQFGTGDLVVSGESGFTIKAGDATAGTEVSVLRATPTQRVGIGTINPTETLHVVGSIKVTQCPGDMELFAGWCMEKTDRPAATRSAALNTCSSQGRVMCPSDVIFACDALNSPTCSWNDVSTEKQWAAGACLQPTSNGYHENFLVVHGDNLSSCGTNAQSYKYRCCKMLP